MFSYKTTLMTILFSGLFYFSSYCQLYQDSLFWFSDVQLSNTQEMQFNNLIRKLDPNLYKIRKSTPSSRPQVFGRLNTESVKRKAKSVYFKGQRPTRSSKVASYQISLLKPNTKNVRQLRAIDELKRLLIPKR